MGDVAPGIAVEVDRAALLAEAEAIAGTQPDAGQPGQAGQGGDSGQPVPDLQPFVDPQVKADQVKPFVAMGVNWASLRVAPNWAISPAEADQLAGAIALVLAYWMPDDVIEPRWAAVGMLAITLVQIVEARRDDSGQLKPMREDPNAAGQASADTPQGSLAL